MTQQERDPQSLVASMQWERVALEPDPEIVAEIDEELPDAWLQTLENTVALELEQEVLQPIQSLSEEELNERVRNVIEELDIDMQEIMQELDTRTREPARDKQQELDFDR